MTLPYMGAVVDGMINYNLNDTNHYIPSLKIMQQRLTKGPQSGTMSILV